LKTLLVALNAKFIHTSLALRSLRAYAEREPGLPGIEVKEYTINNDLLRILADIFAARPDVIGFACYIWNITATLSLAGLVRKVLPETMIVLGGPEAGWDAEGILAANHFVDAVITGEGEVPFLRVLMAAAAEEKGCSARRLDLAGIPGVTCREAGGKGLLRTPAGPEIPLASIPFPYRRDEMDGLRDRILYYESSRGCPFGCSYCLSGGSQGVRFLEWERIKSDLDFFLEHEVRQVKFVDRTFNCRKEHYLPILQYLSQQNCRTNFHFELCADLLDEDFFAVIEATPPGRFQFEIGVQSVHAPTLAAIGRHTRWPELAGNVRRLQSAGRCHLHLDLIAGLPKEDFRQFGRSFDAVLDLRPDYLQIGFLKLLKGSKLRQQQHEFGYAAMDNPPYEVLASADMTYSQMRHLKIIEDVFNCTYNSGRLRTTLDFMAELGGGSAFSLYCRLAEAWERDGYWLAAPGAASVYRFLADFAAAAFPAHYPVLTEFIKYDVLLAEGNPSRVPFLPWSEGRWRDEIETFWRTPAVVGKYLDQYRFTSWRDIRRHFHIEVFGADVVGYQRQKGAVRYGDVPVLFSFADGLPKVQLIEPADFFTDAGKKQTGQTGWGEDER